MQTLLINLPSNQDLLLLIGIAEKMGFNTKVLTENEQRLLKVESFINLKPVKNHSITRKDILNEVKKVRRERHAKKN